MAVGHFGVGQRVLLLGQEHRIFRAPSNEVRTLENMSTGRLTELTLAQMCSQWSRGELRFYESVADAGRAVVHSLAYRDAAIEAFRQSYPKELWGLAVERLTYVRRLAGVPCYRKRMVPLIAEIFENKELWRHGRQLKTSPNFATVARWIKAYNEAGEDIRALCDRHHAKGNTVDRYGEEVARIVDDVIETKYLTLERPTVEDCLIDLAGRIARINIGRPPSEHLRKPGRDYFTRRIKALPAYDVKLARYGKRIADLAFRQAGLGPRPKAPLERACMDHSLLDLVVVDEQTGLPLGRPWLTLILDECTRYVLGYYLGFEVPSSVSMARALRKAISPKHELLAQYPGVKAGWDAWGTMTLLIVDNGFEFHGEALEGGAERYGIELQFCPRKSPWYKGKIERFFGTLGRGLLGSIPGKTFSSILLKEDYNPEKNAVVGLSALREVVLTWITGVYHQMPHRGLQRRTPADVWAEMIPQADRWLPADSLATDAAFSKKDTRMLTHKGIEYDSLFYNSDDLRQLREEHGAQLSVEVRVMDDDLGALVVVAPDGVELIRVPALDQPYAAGLTRWQHAVCKRYQRKLLDDKGRSISLLEAREHIAALVQHELHGRRSRMGTRKRGQRFIERSEAHAQSVQPVPVIAPAPKICTADAPDAPSGSGIDASLHVGLVPPLPVFKARKVAPRTVHVEQA